MKVDFSIIIVNMEEVFRTSKKLILIIMALIALISLSGCVEEKNHKLTVIGSTAGAQTNYPMKLSVYNSSGTDAPGVVYLGGKVRSDFGDLRFTKSDTFTPLDYWIESYTPGVSAVVWVNIDLISANPSKTDIYLHSGNSSAMSESR